MPEQTVTGAAAGRDAGGWSMREWEHALCADPTVGVFSAAEIDGLPEPVQRYFKASIAVGTPLAPSARFRMRGHIKVGRWLPFRARQVLNPQVGFVWAARAAGVIAGYDRYLDGVGEMKWKLLGLLDVAHGEGSDISTSAAGRCAVEATMLPTALLPRFGTTWTAEDDDHITYHRRLGATSVDVELVIDHAGLVCSLVMARWGEVDATGAWGWRPFGGVFSAHRTFAGITVPSAGRLGWDFGTGGWTKGEFFRFEITALEVPALYGGFAR
jgi:hypothetical protein